MNAVPPRGAPLGVLAMALAADEDGTLMNERLQLFENASDRARRRMSEPLPPQEHEVEAAVARSARECADVIRAVWKVLHP